MEKKGARLFQLETETFEHSWNVVEHEVLESRRQLRQKVNELIRLVDGSTLTTREMQQQQNLAPSWLCSLCVRFIATTLLNASPSSGY